MVSFEKCRAVLDFVGGKRVAKIDIQVSTVEELPHLGDVIGDYVLAAGSTAQIIQSDKPLYLTIDANGTWYPEQS